MKKKLDKMQFFWFVFFIFFSLVSFIAMLAATEFPNDAGLIFGISAIYYLTLSLSFRQNV